MTGPRPEDVQASFCAVLCQEWARAGVTEAVVSPGSRSTPLVAALDTEASIRVTVVLDERSAGFTALGMALATGRPAVVVTTSGTASVELHPAVVEASQAGAPLIAVTTDRPPELHSVGAPQTVDQHGLFAAAVRWAADPGVADAASAAMWRSLAARAVAEAVAGPAGPGPVHLNLPFREPLLGDPAGFPAPPGRPGGGPWHSAARRPPRAGLPAPVLQDLEAAERGLIVAGAGAGSGALDLAEATGWPVLADPRSGCRVPHPLVVSHPDALLRVPEVAAWQPALVVRAGAPWASKVLGQWLAALPPGIPQILCDPWGRWADPERAATAVVAAGPEDLREYFGGHIRSKVGTGPDGFRPYVAANEHRGTAWAADWTGADRAAGAEIDLLTGPGGELDMSEPAVARAALAAVPDGGILFASSSMPVRDVEWYGAPRRGARVLANRGANGIDGVLSTALGAALAGGAPTVVLVGDLAFVYDAGALLWARSRPASLSVVVVDNGGGGIFSFLPQASALDQARFERYWGTPHGLDLAALAAGYGVEAVGLADRAALDRFLAGAGRPGVRVGVVASDRWANVAAHERIHAAVALRAGRARPTGPAA